LVSLLIDASILQSRFTCIGYSATSPVALPSRRIAALADQKCELPNTEIERPVRPGGGQHVACWPVADARDAGNSVRNLIKFRRQ
jgi:hypothetical protein